MQFLYGFLHLQNCNEESWRTLGVLLKPFSVSVQVSEDTDTWVKWGPDETKRILIQELLFMPLNDMESEKLKEIEIMDVQNRAVMERALWFTIPSWVYTE